MNGSGRHACTGTALPNVSLHSVPLDSSPRLFCQTPCLTTTQLSFLVPQVEKFILQSARAQTLFLRTPCRQCFSEHLAYAAYSIMKLTTATNSHWYLRGLQATNKTTLYLLKFGLQVHRNRQCTGVLSPTRKDTSLEACQGRARFQQHGDACCHQFFFLQGKAPKKIHAILTETLACFIPGRAKDLSAPL